MTKSKALKLRSHLDKYLIANDDNRSVCVKRNCITRRSTWIVEPTPNEEGGTVRLKSYASGLYLAASGSPSPLGMTGKRVVQSPLYEDEDEDEDKGLIFEWEPIREGFQIKLKARGPRGKFLRANSGPPPWNNSVTHDAPANGATKFWTLWEVVTTEMPEEAPPTWAEIDLLSPSTPSTSVSTDDDDFASGSYPAASMVCPWSPRLSMNKVCTPSNLT